MFSKGFQLQTDLKQKTPIDASITTSLVLQQLIEIYTSIKIIVNKISEGSRGSSESGVSSHTKFSAFSSHSSVVVPNFQGIREDNSIYHIDSMFTNANRLALSRVPNIETKSIFTKIVHYTIKSMLEFIREKQFSSAGFNQIQVDCYFIYQIINDKIVDPSLLTALLNEILYTTSDRSIDPISTKPVVLADIYSRSSSKPQSKE